MGHRWVSDGLGGERQSMFRLTVTLGGDVVERFEFDQDRVIIGRGAEADARIDNLGVSRAHAEIRREGAIYRLVDLKSNNGTFIDGRRIQNHNLNDGDEITIGKYCISFSQGAIDDSEPAPAVGTAESGQTMIMDNSAGAAPKGRSMRVKGYLLLPKRGERRDSYFLDKTVCSIGSGKTAHIRIGGWFIKSKHTVIVRDDMGYVLVAIGKTRINDEEVDEKRLADGDQIWIGKNNFQFMVGRPLG